MKTPSIIKWAKPPAGSKNVSIDRRKGAYTLLPSRRRHLTGGVSIPSVVETEQRKRSELSSEAGYQQHSTTRGQLVGMPKVVFAAIGFLCLLLIVHEVMP